MGLVVPPEEQEASDARRFGSSARAYELYQKLSAADPARPEHHVALGEIALERRNYSQALVHLQAALGLKPDCAWTCFLLGRAAYLWGLQEEWIPCDGCVPSAEDLARRHTPLLDSAIGWLERALRLRSPFVACAVELACVLSEKKDFERGAQVFRQVLEWDPDNRVAPGYLAGILMMTGQDPAEAERLLERAIAVDPYCVGNYYNLGVARSRRGDLVGAESYFRRALDMNPADPNSYCSLGLALLRQGRVEESIRVFVEGLQFQGRFGRLTQNLAVAVREYGGAGMADALAAHRTRIERIAALVERGAGAPNRRDAA